MVADVDANCTPSLVAPSSGIVIEAVIKPRSVLKRPEVALLCEELGLEIDEKKSLDMSMELMDKDDGGSVSWPEFIAWWQLGMDGDGMGDIGARQLLEAEAEDEATADTEAPVEVARVAADATEVATTTSQPAVEPEPEQEAEPEPEAEPQLRPSQKQSQSPRPSKSLRLRVQRHRRRPRRRRRLPPRRRRQSRKWRKQRNIEICVSFCWLL
jgi:hypothetical protein